ncbi:MAG: bifunctional 4-hydroxy-2-oxoglutarate aldolase/2-dehydro-3-deoxy-phosphogluconate aldolase [Opitutaceae bacterium]|jgi:2-dehydro-3-deoxyphosphogluconate aldolase / (4S)-4-hydroxy-2-oxoglutarate aldolase|nr:bifunctional 4-hydroxy-2-oxoglutarate aldolase/2-dehydro-3-deoxy-phosphogluconate aldolase [Opitutaceae bacterium]
MSKASVLQRLCDDQLIALLSANDAAEITLLTKALIAGGITNWELPMSCPAIPDWLSEVSPEYPNFQFGLSTVIDTETARRGIIAGARFISTPALRPEVILLCRRYQIPVICGVHSVKEMDAALLVGADALKLYPSEDRFGPTHIREMRAEFPEAKLFAVGGVTAETARDFREAGADAMFVSSYLRDPDDEAPLSSVVITKKASAISTALNSKTATDVS